MPTKPSSRLCPQVPSKLTRAGVASDGVRVLQLLQDEIKETAYTIWQETGNPDKYRNWMAAERRVLVQKLQEEIATVNRLEEERSVIAELQAAERHHSSGFEFCEYGHEAIRHSRYQLLQDQNSTSVEQLSLQYKNLVAYLDKRSSAELLNGELQEAKQAQQSYSSCASMTLTKDAEHRLHDNLLWCELQCEQLECARAELQQNEA